LDIQRFLRNEPIEARPPSSLYRFQKLVRRNRTAFAAGAAVLLVLVIGLGLSLYLLAQERRAVRRAVAAERRQAELREQAEKGLALERQLREMAPITEKFTLAGRLLSQAKMEEAEQVVSDIPSNIQQGSIFYNALAEVYGRMGNWAGAIRNFNRSVTADPTNHYAWHYLAPLLIQTGDLDGYRSHCERALRQFGQTSDPAIAERIAKDCLILPPPESSLSTLTKMADIATGAGPKVRAWPYYAFVKGLAEYRQGHFAGAIEWLRKVDPVEGVPARTTQLYATLAMAQFRLGQTDAARASIEDAVKLAEAKLTYHGRIDWNDELIARFLLREAQALIAPTAPPAADSK
jgi:tetratricopeptide (TPR) repeat protein